MPRFVALCALLTALSLVACGDIVVPPAPGGSPSAQAQAPQQPAQLEPAPACGGIPYEGCCNHADAVVWCNDGGKIQVDACGRDGQTCGWDYQDRVYACGPTAEPDPTGAFPRSCPALK